MNILKKIPIEVVLALLVNIVLVAVCLWLKPAPPLPPLPVEIKVDISDFRLPQPSPMPKIDPPKQAESGHLGGPAAVASSEKITEQAMRDFTPTAVAEVAMQNTTSTERRQEVERIIQEIKTFDGINTVRTALPAGSLPAGHQIGKSYQSRTAPGNRGKLLGKYGGGNETESAVDKALDYLASVQNANGSWGSKESFQTGDAAALSSLALLTFFAHGENFKSKKYATVISNGSDFLVEMANYPDIEFAGSSFGHAILTYALAEGYAVSGSLSLRRPLEERVRSIITRQNKFGSFALNYNNAPQALPTEQELEKNPLGKEIMPGESACDLSLLGWHIQALTAARNAGIAVDGLDQALALATEALVKIHQAEKGGFSQGINMKRFPANDNMNPVGLLGLRLLNAGNSTPARRAEKFLASAAVPKWNSSGKFPLYRWYYHTQALFQSEGGHGRYWDTWNNNLKVELTKHQQADGSWKMPGGDTSFRVKDKTDLNIYSTSLCGLMLQVYYRYLPSYSIAEAAKKTVDADNLDLGGAGLITRLPGGADPLAATILGIGTDKMDPVRFGKFDGIPAENNAPWAEKEFAIFAGFKSTIGVRKATDWPQRLQPNQRIALFLDDLVPSNFKGNLRLILGLVGSPDEVQDFKTSLEVVINGKRLYNSYLLREKQLIEMVIPMEYLQSFGNICQLRNNGKSILAFDAAELGAAEKIGRPLYLLADNPQSLPGSIRNCFSSVVSERTVVQPVGGNSENRQPAADIERFSPERDYVAEWACIGSEYMGNEFQLHYLRQTGREIVDWIAGGGSGVKLSRIADGGKFFDTVFKTEYPSVAALRQVAHLFEGNSRRLPAQIYPTQGEKPLLYSNAAAGYNGAGIATVVIARRFPMPDETGIIALVPWSGITEMTIEKGFFKPDSPFLALAGKIEVERQNINIENNTFKFTGVLPEMTVIRLVKKGVKSEPAVPMPARYVPPEIKFDVNSAQIQPAKVPSDYAVRRIRDTRGFAAIYGNNASFQLIDRTVTTDGTEQFIPKEKQSLELTFKVNDDMPSRHDSVYLPMGTGPKNPEFLVFNVMARCPSQKKRERVSGIPLRFALGNRCYSVFVTLDRWLQVKVPLTGSNPYWGSLRFLEPGRIPGGKSVLVAYEINNISIWFKP